MVKTYFKELQEKIERLEDGFDIKNVEIGLLESEIQDTLKPTGLLNYQFLKLAEMLEEVLEYEKIKPSERITASKTRLINLLGVNTQLNEIMYVNHRLKLFNRELVAKIQLLRVENADLKLQLDNVAKAENF